MRKVNCCCERARVFVHSLITADDDDVDEWSFCLIDEGAATTTEQQQTIDRMDNRMGRSPGMEEGEKKEGWCT